MLIASIFFYLVTNMASIAKDKECDISINGCWPVLKADSNIWGLVWGIKAKGH